MPLTYEVFKQWAIIQGIADNRIEEKYKEYLKSFNERDEVLNEICINSGM